MNIRPLETDLRLLCHTGLGWRILMPDILRLLRSVVYFQHAAMNWYDDAFCPVDGYFEWDFPGDAEVTRLLANEYYATGRIQELFLSGAEIRRLPAICRPERFRRLPKKEHLAHPFYQYIVRPSLTHHHLSLRLASQNGLFALLTINRPPGEPDFSRSDMKALEGLLPFVNFAVDAPTAQSGDSWTAAEHGNLIFDSAGKVLHFDQSAGRILNCALERRCTYRGVWNRLDGYSMLPQVLKRLAANLETLRKGQDAVGPARIRQFNYWGQFEFRGHWLNPAEPGEGNLYLATVHRKIPLPLHLALALRPMPLSPREKQIALLVAMGDTYGVIAAKLHIAERTVIGHTQNIYRKQGIANRTELLATLFAHDSV